MKNGLQKTAIVLLVGPHFTASLLSLLCRADSELHPGVPQGHGGLLRDGPTRPDADPRLGLRSELQL